MTEILCLGALIEGYHRPVVWLPWEYGLTEEGISLLKGSYEVYIQEEMPRPLEDAYHEGFTFEAHNVEFDKQIWNSKCVPEYKWPKLEISQCSDTMALLARNGLPMSLEQGGEVLNLIEKKSKTGDALIKMLTSKRKRPRKDEYYYIYTEERHIQFIDYCVQDVVSTKAISDYLRPIKESEKEIFEETLRINEYGFPIDVESIHKIEKLEQINRELIANRMKEATQGAITENDMKRTGFLKDWINEQGVVCSGVSASEISRMLELPNLPDHVRPVLYGRQELGKSSTSKFTSMRSHADPDDNRIRGSFTYYGASKTGRFAGRGVQPHNIARPVIKQNEIDNIYEMFEKDESLDKVMEYIQGIGKTNAQCFSSLIRGAICAPKGRTFMASDYSAIEARGIFWLARESVGLEEFTGSDLGRTAEIYKLMAGDIYNKSPEEVSSGERSLGKQAILGCGYGMGPSKFAITCSSYGIPLLDFTFCKTCGTTNADLLNHKEFVNYKLKDDPEFKLCTNCLDFIQDPKRMEFLRTAPSMSVRAEDVVGTYREKYHMVPMFWNRLEKAAIEAVSNPLVVTTAMGIKFKVSTRHGRKVLTCLLPSGRMLAYPDPRLEFDVTPWGSKRKKVVFKTIVQTKGGGRIWGDESPWGGVWAENCTQAVARDLLAHSMMKVKEYGYQTVLHVHDEIVVEVPDTYNESDLEKFNKVMEILPDWAKGFPIKAEGWISRRYMKG